MGNFEKVVKKVSPFWLECKAFPPIFLSGLGISSFSGSRDHHSGSRDHQNFFRNFSVSWFRQCLSNTA